jgi:hypothetical protein
VSAGANVGLIAVQKKWDCPRPSTRILYLKKMALTLHNIMMMKRGRMPFHGAMTRILCKNGTSANIFAPPQYRVLHEELAGRTFETAYRAGIFVGQLRTRLAVPGFEMDGPAEAAGALLGKILEGLNG